MSKQKHHCPKKMYICNLRRHGNDTAPISAYTTADDADDEDTILPSVSSVTSTDSVTSSVSCGLLETDYEMTPTSPAHVDSSSSDSVLVRFAASIVDDKPTMDPVEDNPVVAHHWTGTHENSNQMRQLESEMSHLAQTLHTITSSTCPRESEHPLVSEQSALMLRHDDQSSSTTRLLHQDDSRSDWDLNWRHFSVPTRIPKDAEFTANSIDKGHVEESKHHTVCEPSDLHRSNLHGDSVHDKCYTNYQSVSHDTVSKHYTDCQPVNHESINKCHTHYQSNRPFDKHDTSSQPNIHGSISKRDTDCQLNRHGLMDKHYTHYELNRLGSLDKYYTSVQPDRHDPMGKHYSDSHSTRSGCNGKHDTDGQPYKHYSHHKLDSSLDKHYTDSQSNRYDSMAKHYTDSQPNRYGSMDKQYTDCHPNRYGSMDKQYTDCHPNRHGTMVKHYTDSQPNRHGLMDKHYTGYQPNRHGSMDQHYTDSQPNIYGTMDKQYTDRQPNRHITMDKHYTDSQPNRRGSMHKHYTDCQPNRHDFMDKRYTDSQPNKHGSIDKHYTDCQPNRHDSIDKQYTDSQPSRHGSMDKHYTDCQPNRHDCMDKHYTDSQANRHGSMEQHKTEDSQPNKHASIDKHYTDSKPNRHASRQELSIESGLLVSETGTKNSSSSWKPSRPAREESVQLACATSTAEPDRQTVNPSSSSSSSSSNISTAVENVEMTVNGPSSTNPWLCARALKETGKIYVCQVCDDVAAGFHCGAYVCEACKKFFVRCLKQESCSKYVCPRQRSCKVTKETRTQCQYCRYQKCLQIGMYKPGGTNVSSEIRYIPCKVCTAPSSGYHFGAITCEGCKGFFRRTVKERDSLKYQCSNTSRCVITVKTRNTCKSCRYQKCLEAGMTTDGSRIGRQPNAVKHATLIQLQQFKSATMNISPSSSSSSSSGHQVVTPKIEPDLLPLWSPPPPPPPAPLPLCVDDENASVDDIIELTPKMEQLVPPVSAETSGEKAQPVAESLGKAGDSELTYNEIISILHECSHILHKLQVLKKKPFDDSVSPSELWDIMMNDFTLSAQTALQFAKKLPGFRQTSMQSQIMMMQMAMYPMVLLQLSVNYDLVTTEYDYFNYSKEQERVIMSLYPAFKTLITTFHSIGFAVKSLRMDDIEVVFLSCLYLFSQSNEAEHLMEVFLDALNIYCSTKEGACENRYSQILLQLGALAKANVLHLQSVIEIAKTCNVTFPQLFQETFFN